MALSAEQIEAIREYVGDTPADEDLNIAFDLKQSLTKVVVGILNRRIAVLASGGAITWNLSGVYSESRSENLKALQALLDRAEKRGVGTELDPEPGTQRATMSRRPTYWPR